jgi:hypothetical protein
MPYVAGARVISTDEQGDPVYEDVGPTPRFIQLTRAHRKQIEAGPAAARPAPKPRKAASKARPRR